MIRHAPSIGIGIGLSLRGSGARFTGLLDSYPGAAAAYSLRALTSSWLAGDVVEVRRSSDSTTQGFTASEVSNGTLESFCGAGDGFVSTWYDQSGNGNDATQATTTAQPKIVSAGALVTGGLDFDGTDDFLEYFGGIGLSGTTHRSSFWVLNPENVTSTKRIGWEVGPTSPGGTSNHWRNTAEFGIRTEGGNEIYGGGVVATDLLNSNFLSGTNVTDNDCYINGALKAATSSTPQVINTVETSFRIGTDTVLAGSTTCFDGQMSELIIYASDQTANRAGIETNINDHYSIY